MATRGSQVGRDKILVAFLIAPSLGAFSMEDLTLESLARRVAALEAALGIVKEHSRPKDWRRTIGMFADSPFMDVVDAEVRRQRDMEREAASDVTAPSEG